jgi:predicted nucleic acid-binding protein
VTFADIPAGASVFIDANIFIYHFARDPALASACTALLLRVARQEIRAFTSTHAVADVAHRMMTVEAIDRFGWPAPGIANRLRRHPAEVQTLTRFRQAVQDIAGYGVQVLSVPASLLDPVAALSQQYGLLTNDALIVAVMRANGLTDLASHDADFDHVPGLTRFTPA